ncbi:uncharacterized protein LOC131245782 [Magnolia sinica]|uniref:uncharacterized protein LOC131245782 n=1 Tax=Magnolia sinica TaxID=86752 RepID=UPI00265B0AFB|nr:uncharacterized protein LOC131245782 [Magnolia sinica]
MAIDAKDDVFPVSYAFVESKNVGNWKWFCDELAQVLECILKLTFMSEREEGILDVVSDIFPYASHRYSQESLVGEICLKFNCGDLNKLFKSAVYVGGHSEFDACMCEIHDKYKKAWNIVNDINPEHWATSHFEEKLYFEEGCYFDVVGEWWDKLEGWRKVPINRVLVNLLDYMIEIFNERLNESSSWDTQFVPRVEQIICVGKITSENYCASGGAAEFEVHDVNNANADPNKVDLKWQTCSCLIWQRCGYPCEHVIAAIEYSGRNVYNYFDVYFMVAKYSEIYSEVINPLHLAKKSLSKGNKKKYVESEEVSLTD